MPDSPNICEGQISYSGFTEQGIEESVAFCKYEFLTISVTTYSFQHPKKMDRIFLWQILTDVLAIQTKFHSFRPGGVAQEVQFLPRKHRP
jgi:hypothetical protein